MLKLVNIKKDYYVADQTIEALKGLTVDFRKNEFVSVLGPSGCGKTTLMNLIGGLDQYTSGDLIINGKSTKDFNDRDWDNYRNKKIGFVFQTYNLIPHQTVIENVELALTLSGISKEERRNRATKALEEVGLGDQLKKRPNQLSGGQMQRVAIARALVNSPDILLADEPTGALDTQTSEQIIDLIKEISKDRLVIMVTHNPELAEKYSSRLIKMVDGVILEDSAPYDSENDEEYKKIIEEEKNKEIAIKQNRKLAKKERNKTSMSFFTALSLSLKNLNTKKGRTILTSFAGSIGIIGIALILAISSGINTYINDLTVETMATNPITISATAFDLEQAISSRNNVISLEKFPAIQKILVEEQTELDSVMKENDVTADYVQYVKDNIKDEWVNDINYDTELDMNFYGIKKGNDTYSSVGDGFSELGSLEFTEDQYEAIYGSYPTNKNEVVVVVDEYNRISEETLVDLGYKIVDDGVTEYEFSEIVGTQFKVLTNDQMYEKSTKTRSIVDSETGETIGTEDYEYFSKKSNMDMEEAEDLTVVGVLRLRTELEDGILTDGICYTRELKEWIQSENMSSEIVNWMNDADNDLINPLSGYAYEATISQTTEEQRDSRLRKLGGIDVASDISIYPVDFETKEAILDVLDQWNTENENNVITYSDMAAVIASVITEMVDYISYALIAFTAVSLLVSSIMIGIITYVSVLERTKEIGILRAIGARKKDITRVFNAETFLIGLLAGIIGIAATYILSIPINLIVYNLAEIETLASLPIYDGLILIVISVALTVISGLIPAFKAAKKDPVLALRTE
jgi:putative ABC transport system permease protein